MKSESFQEFLKIYDNIALMVQEYFKDKLSISDDDSIEIKGLTPHEEFQSDCDGDDDNITCFVEIKLKSKKAIARFKTMLEKEQYQFRQVKIRSTKDPLWGDCYTFQYDFYDIKPAA